MNKLVIRPLVDQLYDPDNISVGKKLLDFLYVPFLEYAKRPRILSTSILSPCK